MHPKNTTAPQQVQQILLTHATEFSRFDGESRNPFAVQAGIPAEEAMNMAYGLMDAVIHLATEGIDRCPETHDVISIRFMAQAAQALVLACTKAVEQGVAK